MLIDHQISAMVAYGDDSIIHALTKISRNRAGLIYLVSPHGVLEGVMSDGDFRRWIVDQADVDLDVPAMSIANRTFVSASVDDPPEVVAAHFSARIKSVPLIDAMGRLQAIAWPSGREIMIGDHRLGPDDPVLVIAEIGNNHNGDLGTAIELTDAAIDAGADVVKFQMRDMESLYLNAGDPTNASEDLGTQYTLDLLARFQLSEDELFEVLDHCRSAGATPLCTPWDVASLERLQAYGLDAYKIASADLTNHELVRAAAATGRPLILSTGMSTEAEVLETSGLLRRVGAPFVLLHCNSSYPAPFRDVQLGYMDRLAELGDFPVGYSGHERGTAVAIAAVARGARVIEKHLTFDRRQEGNDHKVSLIPAEFASMVAGIREVEQALGTPAERILSQGEVLNREVLAKSLVASGPIKAGERIAESMIDVKSPGNGLQPNHRDELIGRVAVRDFAAGDFFYDTDLQDRVVRARSYDIGRPWGLPVRYHDWDALVPRTNPDLLEIHLSYRDLDLDGPGYFPEPVGLDLVVHAPELFAGDHLLDLCTGDDEYRQRSIKELQRVIDLTRDLAPRFANTSPALIVVNVGGFSLDEPLRGSERESCYGRLTESLSELHVDGVELIPQTMPPFPWHMGGQRFHNLFVEADEIVAFCRGHRMRVCLDVSHSKLACNHLEHDFRQFVQAVAPHTAHLHLVDAEGVDGEGLQIGDGEIDFAALAQDLAGAPTVSFIPEIWQGHKNKGEGFWMAMERLEQWF
ncbi:MAG: N-acetylneuraminate synthase family protein [Acidimicrobiales bacterium]